MVLPQYPMDSGMGRTTFPLAILGDNKGIPWCSLSILWTLGWDGQLFHWLYWGTIRESPGAPSVPYGLWDGTDNFSTGYTGGTIRESPGAPSVPYGLWDGTDNFSTGYTGGHQGNPLVLPQSPMDSGMGRTTFPLAMLGDTKGIPWCSLSPL